MRNCLSRFRIHQKRSITGFFGSVKDDYAKHNNHSVDVGPMVPGRKRTKPIRNDPEEKSAFLFPRWETKYVDSIDVLAFGYNR